MIFALYLHIAGFGWIQFERYESLDLCEKVLTHIVEGHPRDLEGLCLEVSDGQEKTAAD